MTELTDKQKHLNAFAIVLKTSYPHFKIRFQNSYTNEDCGDYCLSYDTIEDAIAAIDDGYIKTVITVEVL